MKTLKLKKLFEDAIVPTRAHPFDAGLDVFSYVSLDLYPGQTVKIATGIAFEIEPGFVGFMRDRSSVSLRGLKITAGVVDAGYTGEACVVFTNTSNERVCIHKGDKIAQLLVLPVALPEVEVVKELTSESGRQDKGWGSTGS